MPPASLTSTGCKPACASPDARLPALIHRLKSGPSGILRLVFLMRWLLMVLLVSLVGLLIAALGVARHIVMQRARSRSKPPADAARAPGQAEETDAETEI